MANCLVFTDVETTGLDWNTCEILSVGIVVADAGDLSLIDKKEWYIKPERIELAHPKALEVNGYTAEKWASAGERPAAEVFAELPRWLRRGEFAGHHCPFDIDFIWGTAARLGVPGFPKRPWDFTDTKQLAKLLSRDGTIPNNKLDSLVAYYGFGRGQYHGALEDADLSRRSAQAIYRQFRLGAKDYARDASYEESIEATEAYVNSVVDPSDIGG